MPVSKSVASVHMKSPLSYVSPTKFWLIDLQHMPRGSCRCRVLEQSLVKLHVLLRGVRRPAPMGHQFRLSAGKSTLTGLTAHSKFKGAAPLLVCCDSIRKRCLLESNTGVVMASPSSYTPLKGAQALLVVAHPQDKPLTAAVVMLVGHAVSSWRTMIARFVASTCSK